MMRLGFIGVWFPGLWRSMTGLLRPLMSAKMKNENLRMPEEFAEYKEEFETSKGED